MEEESNIYIDKLVLYILAIIFPILALTIAILIDYGKNNDIFLKTDTPGDEDGKMKLSKQRADIIKIILTDFGVPIDNIVCVYMGGTNNWGNNLADETMRQNRVVTIELKE